MDSMKSLNKSLPKASNKVHTQPPEQLIQAFRTAALSVTNLYKISAADQSHSRHLGYQDALDNLLVFLDSENLGLGDGEGWRVRQWATERLDGTQPVHAGSDSDDDRVEARKRTRSPSPTIQRKQSQETLDTRQPSRSASPVRVASAPPTITPQPGGQPSRPEIFSFRSALHYPQDVEMQPETLSPTIALTESAPEGLASLPTPAVRLEVLPRGSRTTYRNGHYPNRHHTRSSNSTRPLGVGAGSKRKTAFGDFFDLGNLPDGKDSPAVGSKRGRYV